MNEYSDDVHIQRLVKHRLPTKLFSFKSNRILNDFCSPSIVVVDCISTTLCSNIDSTLGLSKAVFERDFIDNTGSLY